MIYDLVILSEYNSLKVVIGCIQTKTVNNWVEEVARLTKPDDIVWIDGSAEEKESLTRQALSTGELYD